MFGQSKSPPKDLINDVLTNIHKSKLVPTNNGLAITIKHTIKQDNNVTKCISRFALKEDIILTPGINNIFFNGKLSNDVVVNTFRVIPIIDLCKVDLLRKNNLGISVKLSGTPMEKIRISANSTFLELECNLLIEENAPCQEQQ